MKKILSITLLCTCLSLSTLAQDGVKIEVTETTLNDLIDLTTLSHLLSYSVWERGGLFKLILNCDDGVEFKDQEFYHATLASTVSIDIQANNRFVLSSTQKTTEGTDIFLIGTGNVESPIAIFNNHLMIVHLEAIGTIEGSFTFENHKLQLMFDNVDLNVRGITEGGTSCTSSWAFPVGFLDSPWEVDVNIGGSLLPDALKGYFTSNSPVITTTSNKLTVLYETIPFRSNQLDNSYSTTAAYAVDIDGATVPSSASASTIIAGGSITLKNFTVEQGATFSAKIQQHNFGSEVID